MFLYLQSESPSGSKLNALSSYLLVSLFFVFGTMVEFSLVLIIKQKLEWDGYEPEKILQKKNTSCCHNFCKVDTIEEMGNNPKRRDKGGIQQQNLRGKQPVLVKVLPRTTKIDIVAFFVFNFGYFVFNCFYWFHFWQITVLIL